MGLGNPPEPIAGEISRLLQEARANSDSESAWSALGDAHILSQPWPKPHFQVHAAMLRLALSARAPREVIGQIFRLAVAFPASAAGRYPTGNSGRADVSAFKSAPIRPDLAELLTAAGHGSKDG